jgi:hypothetical protein
MIASALPFNENEKNSQSKPPLPSTVLCFPFFVFSCVYERFFLVSDSVLFSVDFGDIRPVGRQ